MMDYTVDKYITSHTSHPQGAPVYYRPLLVIALFNTIWNEGFQSVGNESTGASAGHDPLYWF